MSDDHSEGIAKAGAAAAIAAIDPTGGIGIAIAQHLAANMTQDSAWRRHAHDLWVDVLLEENDERRTTNDEKSTRERKASSTATRS